MIRDPRGDIDYDERGSGRTLVLVPGSCSTGAAWRPVMSALGDGYRCITTSLPGYGGTAERRTAEDLSIERLAEVIEAVVHRAAAPVHLVGHSFGGLVAVAVASRAAVPLASLTLLEAPAMMVLADDPREAVSFAAFRDMNSTYFAAFDAGEPDAVAEMIDFYGGAGTFASWPERIKAYARETAVVNIRDWRSAYGFALTPDRLGAIRAPTLVAWGGVSHPAVARANARLAAALPVSRSHVIDGAAHFMIATHAAEAARLVKAQVSGGLRDGIT